MSLTSTSSLLQTEIISQVSTRLLTSPAINSLALAIANSVTSWLAISGINSVSVTSQGSGFVTSPVPPPVPPAPAHPGGQVSFTGTVIQSESSLSGLLLSSASKTVLENLLFANLSLSVDNPKELPRTRNTAVRISTAILNWLNQKGVDLILVTSFGNGTAIVPPASPVFPVSTFSATQSFAQIGFTNPVNSKDKLSSLLQVELSKDLTDQQASDNMKKLADALSQAMVNWITVNGLGSLILTSTLKQGNGAVPTTGGPGTVVFLETIALSSKII